MFGSEIAAVERAASGSEAALDDLLRPLLKPAYHLAFMMLRDQSAAEDAVQEAALKSWRKLSKLRGGADPRPWFLGFVANECRNMRRSRWRSVIRLGDRDDIAAPDQKSAGDPDLRRALASLPDSDRVIVLLHFYLDMSVEEIGIVVKSRPAAVRSRLYRAVKRMRPRLDVEEAING
jgi:RNA polymerase sigma-70 factor (ECF subfamily)